jgi:hypothetical protein
MFSIRNTAKGRDLPAATPEATKGRSPALLILFLVWCAMLGSWTLVGGAVAPYWREPLSRQALQGKMETLAAFKAGLEAYRAEFGRYPETDGTWVHGAALRNLLPLPLDVSPHDDAISLRADAENYKLIVTDPHLCRTVRLSNAEMIDPVRFVFSNMPLQASFDVHDATLLKTARKLMVTERCDPALPDHIRAKCWGVGYWTPEAWLW